MIRQFAVLWLAIAAALAETRTEYPFAGVTHIIRTEDLPRPVHMHIMKIDLQAEGIRCKLTWPAGTRETVRQTTLDFLKQEKAQIAVNAHFFLPYPSTDADAFLVGLAIAEGRLYSLFEDPEQSYALVRHAPAIGISRTNQASIVRAGDSLEGIETAFAGSAQIITKGKVTIPQYGDALKAGGPRNYSEASSWYDVATARTLIGLADANRTLVLFTADNAGGSKGMKVPEAAALLIADYGVTDALNMDGGGSTSLAMEAPDGTARMVNVPTSDPRKVGSNLAIFAIRRP